MSSQKSDALFSAVSVMGGVVDTSPQSDEETPDQIKDKSLELKDGTIENLVEEAGDRAQMQSAGWQENGKRYVTKAIKRGKDRILQTISQN